MIDLLTSVPKSLYLFNEWSNLLNYNSEHVSSASKQTGWTVFASITVKKVKMKGVTMNIMAY